MRVKKKISGRLTFEYFINVSNDGLFTTYLPKEVLEKLEAYGVYTNQGLGHRYGYFNDTTMAGLEEKVAALIKKFNERKLVESKIVLRYEIVTDCSYVKTKKGEIVPNGYWKARIDGESTSGGCRWEEGTRDGGPMHHHPFGFSIYAEPMRLNVWEYPDKEQFKEYVPLTDDEKPEGSTLEWLDDLCGIDPDDNNKVKDIDYTEDVGIFFKNAILYICNLNEKLKKVFGENMEITQKSVLGIPKL